MWRFFLLLFIFSFAIAHEPYCYNIRNPSGSRLERCPENGWFNYYDCCDDNYRCCNNFRWFLLIVFILPWLLLLIGILSALAAYMRRRKDRRNKDQGSNQYYYTNPNSQPIQRGTQVITVDIPERKY